MTPMQEAEYRVQIRERDHRIRDLEETVQTLREEADRFIWHRNGEYPEGEVSLREQLLYAQARVVQLVGDLMDFHTVCRNVSIVYDTLTGGRLSKPTYFPSVIIGEIEEAQNQEFEELYAARMEEERDRGPFTFEDLEEANRGLHVARLSDANGRRCSEVYEPIDSRLASFWSNAFAGEAGEAANKVKKMERITLDPAEYPLTERLAIAEEVADTVIYGDLLCQRLGVSLASAIQRKFNRVSARMGSLIRL